MVVWDKTADCQDVIEKNCLIIKKKKGYQGKIILKSWWGLHKIGEKPKMIIKKTVMCNAPIKGLLLKDRQNCIFNQIDTFVCQGLMSWLQTTNRPVYSTTRMLYQIKFIPDGHHNY